MYFFPFSFYCLFSPCPPSRMVENIGTLAFRLPFFFRFGYIGLLSRSPRSPWWYSLYHPLTRKEKGYRPISFGFRRRRRRRHSLTDDRPFPFRPSAHGYDDIETRINSCLCARSSGGPSACIAESIVSSFLPPSRQRSSGRLKGKRDESCCCYVHTRDGKKKKKKKRRISKSIQQSQT